jgi:hypothetical protein
MLDQFLSSVFPSGDLPGLLARDPGLAMAFAFIVVPIALAILFYAIEGFGRLLRGDTSGGRSIRQIQNRLRVLPQPEATATLERRRYVPLQPNPCAVCQLRRRHRPGVRRIRDRRVRRHQR